MSLVDIRWHPNTRELREFGLVVLIGTGLIGLVFQFWRGQTTVALVIYAVGGVLGLPGLTGRAIGLPGYWLWMGVACVMGNIMGRVLLTVIYYSLFLPMGIVRRALGNDSLNLKRRPVESYWCDVKHKDDPDRYERQF